MLSILFSTAMAQEAGAAAQPNAFMSMLPLALVFFIFYFLMIRPQKKKMQNEQKFVSSLQKGDEIYTKSGIIGTIHGLTDKIVTLEVEGGNKIKFLKSQLGGSTKEIFGDPKDKK